jgi:hypothetical protein
MSFLDPPKWMQSLDPGAKLLHKTVFKDPPAPPAAAPPPPNQDTAANATLVQNDQLRRRRGIFANILSSSTGNPGLATGSPPKSTLG